MTATLRDIADRSGVSVQTASQVLNDKGGPFRPETRDRILQAAQELGYRANAAARATRSGRTGCIALLLSSETNNSLLPRELLEGIQDAVSERGLSLVLARIPDDALQEEDRVPRILQEWAVDGLLINYNDNIPAATTRIIERHQIPSVWINSKQPANCVYPDDERGGREAAEYLLGLGHRRIAYVDFVLSTHYSSVDRQRGYEAAMRDAGCAPRIVREHPHLSNFMSGEAEWLTGQDRPTAVIAYSPYTLQTLLILAMAYRLPVPETLSLIGFGLHAKEAHPLASDTLLLPERRIGQIAVEMLEQIIAAPQVKLPPRAVPAEKRFGWTTAPPLLQELS